MVVAIGMSTTAWWEWDGGAVVMAVISRSLVLAKWWKGSSSHRAGWWSASVLLHVGSRNGGVTVL